MNIAYCTRLIPHIPNLIERYPNNKFIISVDKYINGQISGIEQVTNKRVKVINIPEVPSYPRFPEMIMHKRIWHGKDKDSENIDVGFINLPIVRQLIISRKVRKCLRQWIKESSPENRVIITYSTNPMSMTPVIRIKKRYKDVKAVLVVGDLIGDKGIDIKRKGIFNTLLNHYYTKGARQIKRFDGYIFVSKYMAEELGVQEKPNIVIEGVYDNEGDTYKIQDENNDESLKVVFHAGALERKYGVFNLIDAFSRIKNSDYRLWLAGASTESDRIKQYCVEDSRIHYYGFISPQQVQELQGRATVIVNPRTNEGEYTKYSFPSKTMEGLASGKPFIGCRLKGIPCEYFEYINVPEDERPESLMRKIVELCELSKAERDRLGMKSREFITQEKSCRKQGIKIYEFLKTI